MRMLACQRPAGLLLLFCYYVRARTRARMQVAVPELMLFGARSPPGLRVLCCPAASEHPDHHVKKSVFSYFS